MTQQLRFQPEVRAKAIQCKGRANKFLIRRWDPGNNPVQISQQLTALIENTDTPHPLFRTNSGFESRLQRRTKCSPAKQGLALALHHGWWGQQRWRRPEGQLWS